MKLNEYLKSHATKDKALVTNTRIPDKEGGGNGGGSYHVKDDELDVFYQTYHRAVFDLTSPALEYLTEMQREVGPLAIDIDFRYEEASRAYTAQHVEDFVDTVMEELNDMFADLGTVEVFVMEKMAVNATNQCIKDGIHLIFALNLHRVAKEMLRRRLLPRMDEIWSTLSDAITNDWESVLDHNVMVGATAWQLIGSRKPRHEAYRHTYTFKAVCTDKIVNLSRSPAAPVTADFLPRLSVRYLGHPTPELNEFLEREFEEVKTGQTRKKVAPLAAALPSLSKLSSAAEVDQALEVLFANTIDYTIREMHEYVMLLPATYYEPYAAWLKVGFALKNTSLELFPSFIKFSSQSKSFTYGKVGEFYAMWSSWAKNDPSNTITKRSAMYWARKENPVGYADLNKRTLSRLLDSILHLKVITEYDIAELLYLQYKEQFVCVGIKNHIWFEYVSPRWTETDMGSNLRNKISSTLCALVGTKMHEFTRDLQTIDQVTQAEQWERTKKGLQNAGNLMTDLKRTDKKANIMKEASYMFFIHDFMNKLDSKSNILCCANGVIDFNEDALFRQGVAEDYTSKCTNVAYEPLRPEHAAVVDEIETFFAQLFPVKELRDYMWDHLASTLIGKNTNQTFNIYIGNGRNGKSVLVELIGKVLGEYKATVPVSLITQKRPGIGGSSSEVAQLVGIRYAVMQEPSHGERINEGIMKELTGGDPIQARSLYQNSITFKPQMKLVVLTNVELSIDTTDDGTWRRIRMCEFQSVFCEEPVEGDPAKPYQFEVDKMIDQKFDGWKGVLLAMLVERVRGTKGLVVDCAMVISKSNKYRKEQDHFSEFIKFGIQDAPKGTVKQSDLLEVFTGWWKDYTGSKDKCPAAKEVVRYMNRRFGEKVEAGPGKPAHWKGIILVKEVHYEEPKGI